MTKGPIETPPALEQRDVFFAEWINPVRDGRGYQWGVEGVTHQAFRSPNDGFCKSARGHALTKWGARREIRLHKSKMLREAMSRGCSE